MDPRNLFLTIRSIALPAAMNVQTKVPIRNPARAFNCFNHSFVKALKPKQPNLRIDIVAQQDPGGQQPRQLPAILVPKILRRAKQSF